jgi:hypothetical protein
MTAPDKAPNTPGSTLGYVVIARAGGRVVERAVSATTFASIAAAIEAKDQGQSAKDEEGRK